MSRVNVLLGAVGLVVLDAFHSEAPYLASPPAHPFRFEKVLGSDLLCTSLAISLMSLMFFVAGPFTRLGLARKPCFARRLDASLLVQR
jgi:hypothetical protein